MPYTVEKGLLWILLSLLIGAILGYLWHSWRCNHASTSVSSAESEEITRLRSRVANLEPVVAERDKLKLRLTEVDADLKASVAAQAAVPAAMVGIPHADHDLVIGERDRLHGLVGAHETTIGDLRGQLTAAAAGAAASAGIPHADHEAVVADRNHLHGLVGAHETTIGDLRAQLAGCQEAAANAAASAPRGLAAFAGGLGAADLERGRSVYGKAVKMDDLKIVEGIGPVLEGVFNSAGIETWVQLAETDPGRLREILVAADDRHRIHNPTTWPRQSRLAALGEFEALKAWQDSLDAGKE